MLTYGGCVQTYFNYNTGNLASVGITDVNLDTVTAEELAGYDRTVVGTVDGITYYGTSLVLETETIIRYYFQPDEGFSIDNYTFT